MKPYLICLNCGSDDIRKNGTSYWVKLNYRCRDCGRPFDESPQCITIDTQTTKLIGQLLLKCISLACIARVLRPSEAWPQSFMNRFYERIPREANISAKAPSILILQLTEPCSFAFCKANEQWIWLALNYDSCETVGCHTGPRSGYSAKVFWQSLPGVYYPYATLFADYWEAYSADLPCKPHFPMGKETNLSSYTEQFNNTLRLRVSRLVMRTLFFSKKQSSHEGEGCNFKHYYIWQLQGS